MWYECLAPGKSWASLWHGYIRCRCGGIRRLESLCAACGEPMSKPEPITMPIPDGTEQPVYRFYAGGEDRYEDWVYLIMLQREWLRPITDDDRFLDVSERSRPAPRAIIVLVFWTYFETRIDRLYREALKRLPTPITKDLLSRYSSIGARLYQLYKIAFGTSYFDDLRSLGHAGIAELLARVHERRNEFAHGHPEAIDEELVRDVVTGLKDEHESWILVFNKRIAAPLNVQP